MAAELPPRRPGFLPLVAGDGGEAEWILFLLFVAGDGGTTEWILVLQALPGEFLCSDCSCEVGWSPPVGMRMDLLCWVFLLAAGAGDASDRVGAALWISGPTDVGGFGAESKEPMAVGTNRESLAAFQHLGSALCFGLVMIGGWKSRCYARWPVELLRQRRRRKTKHSSVQGLVVIFFLLRVLYAKKDCTVLDL